MYSEHDIHYALETTQILHEPDRRIDTFGSTQFEFHLISELMDEVDQVRVRTGKIQAERPLILKPEPMTDFDFEGFSDQAKAFGQWLKQQAGAIRLLQYGFNFKKSDVTEHLIHDPLSVVTDRVLTEAKASNNPLSAVIMGVDDTWEISLLKFTVDMIQKSHGINMFDFKRRGLL